MTFTETLCRNCLTPIPYPYNHCSAACALANNAPPAERTATAAPTLADDGSRDAWMLGKGVHSAVDTAAAKQRDDFRAQFGDGKAQRTAARQAAQRQAAAAYQQPPPPRVGVCEQCGQRCKPGYALCYPCYKDSAGLTAQCAECGKAIHPDYELCYTCAFGE